MKITNIYNNIAILGLGKISIELSKYIIKNGGLVSGFTSNRERAEILKKNGVKVYNKNSIKLIIEKADSLIITAPPDTSASSFVEKYKKNITNSNISWIGYLSSTGVYGDYKGMMVNENSTLKSNTNYGILRIKEEEAVKNFSSKYKIPFCIFRLSGIYGPHRSIIHKILDNTFVPIHKNNHFFNRIHEYDIARVLCLAAMSRKFEGVINLTDDVPAPQIEVARFSYKLLNKEIPTFLNYEHVQKTLSTMSKNFWQNSRKVDNSLLKKIYGKLIFPSYKEGLLSIYENYFNRSADKF